MEQLEINNEMWGRVMIGKDRNIPTYRKLVDGKWVTVEKKSVPQEVRDAFVNELPKTPDIPQEDVNDFGFDGTDADSSEIEPEDPLENISLKDLCEALYTRFGIYTCYLQREPNNTDVHPITGNLMSNFTLGQARQQYMTARRTGANYNPAVMKTILEIKDQPRFDFEHHFAEHPDRFDRPATEEERNLTMSEYRALREKEKPIMRTEHGRRGDGTDEDELYAEPPINGRTIRPFYTSPVAARRLEENRKMREQNGGRF